MESHILCEGPCPGEESYLPLEVNLELSNGIPIKVELKKHIHCWTSTTSDNPNSVRDKDRILNLVKSLSTKQLDAIKAESRYRYNNTPRKVIIRAPHDNMLGVVCTWEHNKLIIVTARDHLINPASYTPPEGWKEIYQSAYYPLELAQFEPKNITKINQLQVRLFKGAQIALTSSKREKPITEKMIQDLMHLIPLNLRDDIAKLQDSSTCYIRFMPEQDVARKYKHNYIGLGCKILPNKVLAILAVAVNLPVPASGNLFDIVVRGPLKINLIKILNHDSEKPVEEPRSSYYNRDS